jgi:hypothetical protein
MAIVYKHKRIDNNQVFYIGIGSNLKRSYSIKNRNIHWRNIVNITEYQIEIVFNNITWKEACEVEKYLIAFYGRRDLGTGTLVNMTDGGEGRLGYKLSDEQKEVLSKKNIGKKHSNESKLKISNSLIGNKYSRGSIRSDESKILNSIASRGDKNPRYGVKLSDELKFKISQSLKGLIQNKIICPYCDKEGGVSNMKRYHFENCKYNNGIRD